MGELLIWVLALVGGVGLGAAFVVGYLLFLPEKAEKIGGWIAGVIARIFKRGHRTAIALKVQGAVNSARAELLKNAPSQLLDKKLRLRWAKNADDATTLLREGEVLVVMQQASHQEENVAHALMAYLPKAMLPRARRYVDPMRMRAADLIVARSVLTQKSQSGGALSVFFEKHLDPAREESADLKTKIAELDEVDLQGWLVRVLLAEYYLIGEQLYPGEPGTGSRLDAEEFARWLYRLAARAPGEESAALSYKGRYFRVAVIFVAIAGRLEEEGLRPYRRRARRLLWQEKFDAIYLMARDGNISSVEALANLLEHDARVESVQRYRYELRSDFKKRTQIHRDEAIVVCLRRRHGPDEAFPHPPQADLDTQEFDLTEVAYEPDLHGSRRETT